MKRAALLVTVLILTAAVLLPTVGCNKLRARDQLNKGVQAYKAARPEEAVDHFQQAIRLDGDLKVAKMYLATVYAQQYVPDVNTPENLRNAQMAIDQYKEVLQSDPNNAICLKGIANLYREQGKFDDARTFVKKAIDADPNDPENYYTLGVIDFTQAFKNAADVKTKEGIKPDDELKGKGSQKLCDELKSRDASIIDEGIKMLQTAIDKRQDYDDAMVYMNLLYRRKAVDLNCDDAQARADLLKSANEWSDKAMAARKRKQEAAAKKGDVGGIHLDQPKSK
jgi:tetratricopeptide (TPR) repeat protein